MTSGYPLTDTEKNKIKDLYFPPANYFPSDIARYLSSHYTEENGGYRDEKTVRRYINALDIERERQNPVAVQVKEPSIEPPAEIPEPKPEPAGSKKRKR
jgi:hypothetical protein